MKRKDLTYFVRFGSLNLNKQKGFGNANYHSPPASRGFYAFPFTLQEMFLIGGLDRTQPHQFPGRNNRGSGEEELSLAELKRLGDLTRRVQQNIRREFRKAGGSIWHHLTDYVDNPEVIARHNAWVKTSVQAWRKAFRKCSLHLRYGEEDHAVNSINASKKTSGNYVKDMFEVFFDEKVN
jgi:hypothetical protein